jgi:hypothetical protein
MEGFRLPWEEPEVRQVIEAFGCKVISIEEVQDEKVDSDNGRA